MGRWQSVEAGARPGPVGIYLYGMAAASARNAWAAGSLLPGADVKTLISRWKRRTWKRMTSPAAAGGYLDGLAAPLGPERLDSRLQPTGKSLINYSNGTRLEPGAHPHPGGRQSGRERSRRLRRQRLSFAPRRYQRRTSGRGRAASTRPELRDRHDRPSNPSSLARCDLVSQRQKLHSNRAFHAKHRC